MRSSDEIDDGLPVKMSDRALRASGFVTRGGSATLTPG
jgi:hypothetical protein